MITIDDTLSYDLRLAHVARLFVIRVLQIAAPNRPLEPSMLHTFYAAALWWALLTSATSQKPHSFYGVGKESPT